MKDIVFITQRDPFFVDSFFREFLKCGYNVTIFDLPNFNRGKIWALKRALDLYGILGVFKLIILRVGYAIRDFFGSEKIVAKKLDRLPDIDTLRSTLGPSAILVSLSAPVKIPPDWLDAFEYSINIHCGSLPEYAGMMPIFWQAYNSENEVTITIHHMAPEIDTGSVIETKKFALRETLFRTSVYAKRLSARMLHDVLRCGLSTRSKAEGVTHAVPLKRFPSPADIRDLKKRFSLI